VHFLSFLVSAGENLFGQILTSIPGTDTTIGDPEQAKLKFESR